MPDEDLVACAKTVKRVTKALLAFSDGVNVLQNNGKSAGQFVMHAHFHIIPRWDGDGIEIEKWDPHDYPPGEMGRMVAKIKTLLKKE